MPSLSRHLAEGRYHGQIDSGNTQPDPVPGRTAMSLRLGKRYGIQMQRRCVALLLLIATAAHAETFYVTPAGDDDAPGSQSRPLRTIQSASERLQPGDTCVIGAGTYRETVRPLRSGTAGAPIRFVAAAGAIVIISGTECVTNWICGDDGHVAGVLHWSVAQVFVDHRLMTCARTPNAHTNMWTIPTVVLEPGTNGSLSSAELERPRDYWKGATLWALSRRLGWVASQSTVARSEGSQIFYSGKRIPYYGGGEGRGYLRGDIRELDAPGEWHQQDGTLFLRPPGDSPPSGMAVEVTRRRWAFDLAGRSHVELTGVSIFAASVNLADARRLRP